MLPAGMPGAELREPLNVQFPRWSPCAKNPPFQYRNAYPNCNECLPRRELRFALTIISFIRQPVGKCDKPAVPVNPVIETEGIPGVIAWKGKPPITGSIPSSGRMSRSEEHTSELQSRFDLVCRL